MGEIKLTSDYLRDIRGLKESLLDKNDEHQILIEAKKGDIRARHRLIKCNIKFIFKIALRYIKYDLPIADLINEGVLGFNAAIDKYDLKKDMRFISYAVWWIRAYMLRAINEQSLLINKKIDIFDTSGNNEDKNNIIDTEHIVSLNKIVSTISFKGTFQDIIEDQNSPNPENEICNGVPEGIVDCCINELPEIEQYVIKHLFAIGVIKYTIAEIGNNLSIPVTRVRQLRNQALERIKDCDKFKMLDEKYSEYLDAIN